MEQTFLDSVNSVIARVNETIQAAKEQNDSVVGTILIDEEHDEMITIAATPKGELLGSYVFHGVPLITKTTDSPRALAEDLLGYIDNFYDIGIAVESELELSEETTEELGDKTVMAVTIRKGKTFNGRISRTARDPRDFR